jgi:hypothetical protein
MAMSMFETATTSFGNADIDWAANTIKLAMLSYLSTDGGLHAINAATNATPVVVTTTAPHGLAVGELISVSRVGGNLSANGLFRVGAASFAATTFSLTEAVSGIDVTGSGAYTSGGVVVSLGAAGEFYEDFNNCLVSTAVTLGGKASAQGAFDATDPTFPTASGPDVDALLLYQDTGNIATSRCIAFNDGIMTVIAAGTTPPGSTSLEVQALTGDIASGVTLAFTDGTTATTTSSAALGSTLLAVSSTAAQIATGVQSAAAIDGTNFPLVLDGSDVNVSVPLDFFFRFQAYL